MRPLVILYRLLMFALTGVACIWLSRAVSPWAAVGIWAAGIGALCCAVALLMRLQKPGRVTVVNYLAGIILPWGYKIGRGRLWPIVVESWLRWVLLGVLLVVLTPHGLGGITAIGREAPPAPAAEYHRSMTMTVLLLISWIIDG